MDIDFILGEDKHVRFLVHSSKNDEFTIHSAKYELYLDTALEQSGDGTIDGHYIDVKLNPLTKSSLYKLIITYVIADETLKTQVRIEVR